MQERVVVVAGDGGHLLAFDPATSTFEPLGPPPPSVGEYSRIRYAIVRANPLRMLVVDEAPGGPQGVFVSDGGEWRALAEGHEVRARATDTLDLVWTTASHAPRGEAGPESVAMHRFDGGVLFARERRPREESARLVEFGPGGAWYLLWSHPEGYAMHFTGGARVALPDEAGNVRWGFDTSMITQDSVARRAHWRDLEGRVVERDGFTGDLAHLTHRGPYQLVNGMLSWLTDDGVQPLQRLPASVTVWDLRRHEVGRYAIVEELDGLTAYGPDGTAFARYDAPQLPRQMRTHLEVSPRLPGSTYRYLVFVEAWGLEGDVAIPLDRSYELWTFGTDGSSDVVPLARRSHDSNLVNAAVTSNAYFFIEDRRLVQVDFADGARHEWTYEGGLFDAVVRQPDLPGHP